ncbi:MAG TPA: hypothetical protein VNZ85_18430, partial [Caulobacter sp.]|nr:hypothetical protein [Caulobacter sp.]
MEQHAAIDPVVLSTDDLDHHDRDALVREFYGRICMRLDLEAAPGRALNLKAKTAMLPGLSLTRGAVEPMSWERSAWLMSDANDDVCLSWMAGGYLFEPRGREAVELSPGAPCVMPLDQAWKAQAPAG